MKPGLLSYRVLSELTNCDLAIRLHQQVNGSSEATVSKFLLEAVECEGIPPTVFAVWLSIAEEPASIVAAVKSSSRFVRHGAFRRFSKFLREPQWRVIWRLFGGVPGILILLKALSVEDVELLIKFIRKGARVGQIDEGQREEFTHLFRGLFPSMFLDVSTRTKDDRQLSHVYFKLLSACSHAFIDDFFRKPQRTTEYDEYIDDFLLINQPKTFQDLILADLSKERMSKLAERNLQPLLQNIPQLPSNRDGWSASMDFSERVLEFLAYSGSPCFPQLKVMPDLVTPLLKRMEKRNVPLKSRKRVFQMVLRYAESNREMARDLEFYGSQPSSFYTFVIRAWGSDSGEFEQILKTTLKLGYAIGLTSCEARLFQVPRAKRYELLRILGWQASNPAIDIDSSKSLAYLKSEEWSQAWSQAIFYSLERDRALGLLEDLEQATRGKVKIRPDTGHKVANLAVPGSENIDVSLFKVVLGSFPLEPARKMVEESRKQTVKSRQQVERAYHACRAVLSSIASGNLTLYEETLEWTRRFLKDPLTVKSLFAAAVTNTEEGIALLSSASSRKNRSQILEDIQQSNRIMLLLLEFACLAIGEPSFSSYDWNGVLNLFAHVTAARIRESSGLRDHFGLSDEEVYELVWKDTLATLVQAEAIGLKPENKSLGFSTTSGPLNRVHKAASAANNVSAMFLNNLAQARNELWVKKRALDQPTVTTLPDPWPRGLPIQDLFGSYPSGSYMQHDIPWIATRARSIVLMESTIAQGALPNVDVVEPYCDDFQVALRIFIELGVPKGQARKDRASIAWNHAVKNFALKGGQSQEQSEQAWRWMFIPELIMDDLTEYEVVVPEDEEFQSEWNPAANEPPPDKDKTFQANVVHYLVYREVEIQVQVTERRGIWNAKQRGSARNMEGLILSALLYLDAKIGGRILSTAFPQSTMTRFPPLFLAAEFMDQDEHPGFNARSAEQVLERFLSRVPLSLLLAVAQNALKSEDERVLYRILRLLSRSDRPELAMGILCDAILNRPKSSSWFRQIVHRKFLKRLNSKDARDFVQNFARQVKAGKVKITTIKMLAGLLTNGDIFPLVTAISLLEQILLDHTHIDARASALQAMLGLLPKDLSNEMLTRVKTFLANLTPIIGSLSEMGSEVPDSQRPLFDILVNATDSSIKDVIANEVLIPAVKMSIEEHRKWLTSFSHLDVPLITPSPDMLKRMIEIDPEMFKLFNEYVLFMLRIPQELKDFNSNLGDSEEAKHWLSIFGCSVLESTPALGRTYRPLNQDAAVALSKEILTADSEDPVSIWYQYVRHFRRDPALQRMVAIVDRIRTPEWQADPNRFPARLPSTFESHLWLVKPRDIIGMEIKDLDTVKRTLTDKLYASHDEALRVACAVRIDIAEYIFRHCHPTEVAEECRACIEKWRQSSVEEEREAAWRLRNVGWVVAST